MTALSSETGSSGGGLRQLLERGRMTGSLTVREIAAAIGISSIDDGALDPVRALLVEQGIRLVPDGFVPEGVVAHRLGAGDHDVLSDAAAAARLRSCPR